MQNRHNGITIGFSDVIKDLKDSPKNNHNNAAIIHILFKTFCECIFEKWWLSYSKTGIMLSLSNTPTWGQQKNRELNLIVTILGQITLNWLSSITTVSLPISQVNLIMNQTGWIVQLTNVRAMCKSQLNLMVNQMGQIVQLTQMRALCKTPLEISFLEI